jgi:hypothetical protein
MSKVKKISNARQSRSTSSMRSLSCHNSRRLKLFSSNRLLKHKCERIGNRQHTAGSLQDTKVEVHLRTTIEIGADELIKQHGFPGEGKDKHLTIEKY